MTSHPSDRPVSALRTRMIEDMTVRGFNGNTRGNYIRNVRAFAAFIGRSPGTATAEDLRRFQLHQTQSGMQPPSINPKSGSWMIARWHRIGANHRDGDRNDESGGSPGG